MGVGSTQTEADDVAGGVGQALGEGSVSEPSEGDVQRNRGEQLVVLDLAAVLVMECNVKEGK